jgi:hypothetical protein
MMGLGQIDLKKFKSFALFFRNQDIHKPTFIFFLMFFVILMGFISNSKMKEKTERQALKATYDWLALMDSGKYGLSWETTTEDIKSEIKKKLWQQSMKDLREPLGEVTSRNLLFFHNTNIFSGTANKYAEIQFNTSFLYMDHAVEIITLFYDKDNAWRVWKYGIKHGR